MPHSLLRPIKCAKHNAKKWQWHHQCSLGCEQHLPPHRPTARQDGAKALPIFARGHRVIGTKIVESDSVGKNVCWTPLIFVQDFLWKRNRCYCGHMDILGNINSALSLWNSMKPLPVMKHITRKTIEKLRVITSWSVFQLTHSWDYAKAVVLLQTSSPKLMKSKSFSNKEMTVFSLSEGPTCTYRYNTDTASLSGRKKSQHYFLKDHFLH